MAYVPEACVHPSHDLGAHLAAHALDQTFRLVPDLTSMLSITAVLPVSGGVWAGPSRCPHPALLSLWVLWDGALFQEGMALTAP